MKMGILLHMEERGIMLTIHMKNIYLDLMVKGKEVIMLI